MRLMRIVRSRMAVRLDRRGDDWGLTLIELLVTITILGIIVAPLSIALMTYFQHTDDTTERLSISHDAQISAAYFAQDVQSVGVHNWNVNGFPLTQSIYIDVAPTATPYPCGSASTSAKIVMLWDDPTAAKGGQVFRVAYYTKPVSGGLKELHRIICTGAGTTPTSDLVMAHNVDTVDTPSCSSTCTGATPPQTVTLVLHLKSSHSTVNDPLTVTLTGQRRQT